MRHPDNRVFLPRGLSQARPREAEGQPSRGARGGARGGPPSGGGVLVVFFPVGHRINVVPAETAPSRAC